MKHWLRAPRAWVSVVAIVACSLALSGDARGDGVAQQMTSVRIPEATVSVIDPESGTSTGGGSGTDVRLAPGDIILFQFNYMPLPDMQIRGLQGYVTGYIPPNTEVVGFRLIDENDETVPPRYPGLATDGCARSCNRFNSVPCSTGTCNLDDGSIAQVHADTGLFYTTDARMRRIPDDRFISFVNGTIMSPEPRDVTRIANLIEAPSPYRAHNVWDYLQVRAFGTSTAASGNSGTGNTPHLWGSPVAGPLTHYGFEATQVTPTRIEINPTPGPWRRIVYPGSLIGIGDAVTGSGPLARMIADASTMGFDVRPANAIPATAVAVRAAIGEVRMGEPGRAEIALRVLDTPIDPVQGDDVICAEVHATDNSARSLTGNARDNQWGSYIASPNCVYLRLKFDLDVDRIIAVTGDRLTYTLSGKNLSTLGETNSSIRLKFDSSRTGFVSASDGGVRVSSCDGDGLDCIVWPARDLAPSEEFEFTIEFDVGGGGHRTIPMEAVYESDSLPDPGFSTFAVSISKPIGIIGVTLAPDAPMYAAGGLASLSGRVSNDGTNSTAFDELTIVLPTGWTIPGDINFGGGTRSCARDCSTNRPVYNLAVTLAPGASRAISFSAQVPPGTPTGLYDIDFSMFASQSSFGGAYETYFDHLAAVPIGQRRSDPPAIDCPVNTTTGRVTGTTTEADGTVIRVYLNGIQRGTATAAGGVWTFTVPASFGEMYAGLEIKATAQAPGELESVKSAACFALNIAICSDGMDNDGDGLVDFPADPGCSSPADGSEEDTQCSDGIDNDGDGDIDFPDDLECFSPSDDSEGGPPACNDGIDNDGDGLIDFPADPDCTSATDRTEITRAICMNGGDDDGDGLTDFLSDPGCDSAFDQNEVDPLPTPDEVRARLLMVFDTSGSMNWNICTEDFTGGDGTNECAGNDVPCAVCDTLGCGDGIANDSRIDKAKRGVSDVVAGFGEVEYALMRFTQRPIEFGCPGRNASLRSGAWQGGGAAPCDGFRGGDLLVQFSQENQYEMLAWMDGESNFPGGGTPAPGFDQELRGSGTTPIAGALRDARVYLESVRASDTSPAGCRPYEVILLTDGAETCGGNPVTRASQLLAAGFRVNVIGFAVTGSAVDQLDAIAAAGGTGSAILVNDEVALSAAIADIVNDTILFETCNGVDDDCDLRVDEGFVKFCDRPTVPDATLCADPGETLCDGIDNNCNGLIDEGLLNACGECGPTPVETCNRVDDDCDGVIDEGVCMCPAPTAEICDNMDNDCDGSVDENIRRPCGTSVGDCTSGFETCVRGVFGGCTATGPFPEVCDGRDNDCDGVIDGMTRPCGDDTGACSTGIQSCRDGEFGECIGAVGPRAEVCDGVDNDCDGDIDEELTGLGMPCGTDEGECTLGTTACVAGRLVCMGGGGGVPETCDGTDEDCDGLIDEGNPGGGAACGSGSDVGVCERGRLTCVGGELVCTGEVGPREETCDERDNDCDGMIDEGDPGGGEECGFDVGECSLGRSRCVLGTLVCDGGRGPEEEICNGLDDDCDGVIDDGIPVGEPCGTDMGECVPGVNVCRDGELVCEGELGPVAEVCDALDNDCDGAVDEELPFGAPCGETEGLCEPGVLQCVRGREICVGGVPLEPERCDCDDNDCDGEVDEGSLCGGAASCVECQCALPCSASEFGTCPEGREPVDVDGTCFCLREACNDDVCADSSVFVSGEEVCAPDIEGLPACTCKGGECTFPCDGVSCEEPTVCHPDSGRCVENNCRGLGCPAGELCDLDTLECVEHPCAGVACGAGEACRDGDCERSCATVDCPAGERCTAGTCVEDLCFRSICAEGEVCDPASGDCVDDLCVGVDCPDLTVCDPLRGMCEEDPCNRLVCGDGERCIDGECADIPTLPDGGMPVDAGPRSDGGFADAGTNTYVAARGRGGCSGCAVSSTRDGVGGGVLAFLVLAAVLRRLR